MSKRVEQAANLIAGPTGELSAFIGRMQRVALFQALADEEGEHFADILIELAERLRTMPHTYQQDGKGMEATVYLHYFLGGIDVFITEKDVSAPEDNGRHHQAFGWTSLPGGPGELGYVSIPTLLANHLELDLHWEPKTLKEALEDGA